jgi:hypothetical protein
VVRFLLLAIVVALLSGCGGSHASEPSWVQSGVTTLRAYFVGNPRPVQVTWHEGLKYDWVTIRFDTLQTCGTCHGPAGSKVTGRRATIRWLHGRHKVTGVSILPH